MSEGNGNGRNGGPRCKRCGIPITLEGSRRRHWCPDCAAIARRENSSRTVRAHQAEWAKVADMMDLTVNSAYHVAALLGVNQSVVVRTEQRAMFKLRKCLRAFMTDEPAQAPTPPPSKLPPVDYMAEIRRWEKVAHLLIESGCLEEANRIMNEIDKFRELLSEAGNGEGNHEGTRRGKRRMEPRMNADERG